MSVKEDLIAAKALIDTPNKWVTRTWKTEGCYCAVGAVVKALNLPFGNHAIWFAPAYLALEAEVPRTNFDVVAFNDHPDTTHADIMALFDRAINAAGAS